MAALINPVYLKGSMVAKLREAFASSNPKGLQLQGFLDSAAYRQLLVTAGKPRFTLSEIRDLHSFFEDRESPVSNFFKSREFISFAAKLAGIRLSKSACSLKVFTHGRFTLANDTAKGKVEFLFDMSPGWKSEWGGASNYITDQGDRLVIPPLPNNLILVLKQGTSVEGYIKYVNHRARENGRVMVSGTLS